MRPVRARRQKGTLMMRTRRIVEAGIWGAAAASLAALALLAGSGGGLKAAEEVKVLLDTGKTVLGQPIRYPGSGPAQVTAVIVALEPGAETGWHRHDVPMFGYILEGELTVDYGAKGARVYRKGDAAIEAIDLAHNGRNTGADVARVLAVFIGAEGVPDTVKMPGPQ
jgi:quercetin dioxygenase-like cupin family protein